MSRACCALLAQWTFVPRDSSKRANCSRCLSRWLTASNLVRAARLPRALPVLKPQLALVADDFVFAHRRLDDAAMPQVRRNPPGVFVEMGGRGAHAARNLATDGHGWTRIIILHSASSRHPRFLYRRDEVLKFIGGQLSSAKTFHITEGLPAKCKTGQYVVEFQDKPGAEVLRGRKAFLSHH